MNRLVWIGIWSVVWAGGVYGVLNIGAISGHGVDARGICGPWGCGPPISALVAWHGFCSLLALPVVGVLVWQWPARRIKVAALALLVLAIGLFVTIAVWEAVTWLPKIDEGQPTYFMQRCLFSVATWVDVPVIPVTFTGIVLLACAMYKQLGAHRAGSHRVTHPAALRRQW